MYRDLREPELHTNITDELPEDHPQAYENIYCTSCSTLVHAGNNENMDSWLETNSGAYCIPCWLAAYDDDVNYQLLGLYDLEFEYFAETLNPEQAWETFKVEALKIGLSGDEMLWRHQHDEWPPNLGGLTYHLTVLLPLLGDKKPEGTYAVYR